MGPIERSNETRHGVASPSASAAGVQAADATS